MDVIKRALRSVTRGGMRAVLTMCGIGIGVMSVVLMSAVGDIGRNAVGSEMSGMGMDSIVISAPRSNLSGLNEDDLAALYAVEGVRDAMPLICTTTEYSFRDAGRECMVWGVNEDADKVIRLEVVHGRLINRGDLSSAQRVCIIDEEIALSSYRRSNIVGKEITLVINGCTESYEIVGVVKNGVSMLQSMLGDALPSFVYIPYTTMQSDTLSYCFDNIAVKLDNDDDSEAVMTAVERTVSAGRDEVTVENLVKQKQRLDNISEIVSAGLAVIASISLVVSGLSIMTVMLVSVNERTREIGIKKAIGAKRRDICAEFLTEAVILTLLGGSGGAVVGALLSAAACAAVGMEIAVDLGSVAAALGFTAAVGVGFGVYPSMRAASLKPVEALGGIQR